MHGDGDEVKKQDGEPIAETKDPAVANDIADRLKLTDRTPRNRQARAKASAGATRQRSFSRRVVGWSMQTAMTAQLVTDALVMAIWRRGKPDALLHHSDRGSQGGFKRSSQHQLFYS